MLVWKKSESGYKSAEFTAVVTEMPAWNNLGGQIEMTLQFRVEKQNKVWSVELYRYLRGSLGIISTGHNTAKSAMLAAEEAMIRMGGK